MEKVLYFLQHSENCVNTCAFARHWQQKHCKYRDFCYRGKQKTNIVNTVVLGFRGAKNISQYLRCFFYGSESFQKKNVTTTPIWRFGHYGTEKTARVTAVTTTTTTTTRTTRTTQTTRTTRTTNNTSNNNNKNIEMYDQSVARRT